jgi:LuxR family transcriptional regulator, regulator of acetate metabolism
VITEEHGGPNDARAAERVLVELLQLEREIAELEYVRRSDALERAGEAVRRLGELGSAEGILAKAAAELGACAQFDRVLISEVLDGELRPLALWDAMDPAGAEERLGRLRGMPIRLEYPLIEAEVVRHREAELVTIGRGARAPGRLAQAWGWRSYVVAALTAQGETIGLLHADATAGGRTIDGLDRQIAGKYAEGLSGVIERAVLRHTLELHRAELESAGKWIGGRLSRLSDATGFEPARAATAAEARLVQSLTPRELEVLRLLARGNTNLAIANALVVREGTVKYHVKNILRKLGAISRADAVSRFVRSTSSEGSS